jgi:hypothetical protein
VEAIRRKTETIFRKYDSVDEKIKLKTPKNLTEEEIAAMHTLKNEPSIIIKPADKGGATVIMDKKSYLKEAYRQLNDQKYYIRLGEPVYHNTKNLVTDILHEMNDEDYITNEQLEFLTGPKDYRPRSIYFLPKIHKERNKWPWPDMPEARPICSDLQSESYRVGSYIDSFLNPLASKHASFIKNSYDFVKRIRNTNFAENWLLVTGDVSALYTNMHHDLTIEGVKKIFAKNPDLNRPDDHILRLLDLILKNNDFCFNNETFLQILGTAMGKVFSPSLANIYLLDFDDAAMNDFHIKPLLYFRYLDDIFMIWPGNMAQLLEFQNFLNTKIPDIKINFESNHKQISFLDVMIYVDNGQLQTRTYFKNTDTHQLLHTESFHPRHTTKGIIKSQLIRFKRLSSSANDYHNTCKILFSFLKNRGYKSMDLRRAQYEIWYNYKDRFCDTIVNNNINNNINNSNNNNNNNDNNNNNTHNYNNNNLNNDNNISSETNDNHNNDNNDNNNNDSLNNNILNRKNDNNNKKEMLPIIVDYSSIGIELAKNFKELIYNKFGKEKFSLVTAFRNGRNLRQILVSSKFENNNSGAFRGCDQPRCLTCRNHAYPKTQIISTNNNRSIKIHHNITCSSINVIYLITCAKCNLQYIGETGRSLRDRVNDHRSAIKNKSDTPIGVHFNTGGHSRSDLLITPIEIIENVSIRRNKEKALQRFLKTIHPDGINHLPLN